MVNDILNTTTAYMKRLAAAGVRCVNFEDEGPGASLARLVVNCLLNSYKETIYENNFMDNNAIVCD